MRGKPLMCAPGTREKRAAFGLAGIAAAGFLALVAYTLAAPPVPTLDAVFNDGVYNIVQLLAVAGCALRLLTVEVDRAPWALLTTGVAAWATADVLFTFAYDNDPPFPSVADAFYLALYPLFYVGLLLLVRRHIAEFNRSLWFDGVTATLAAATVGAAALVEIVLADSEGSTAAVVTNLAYPVGDVLLLSLVIGVFALSGWQPGRFWLFVGLGLACSAIADATFLFQQSSGSYVPGTPFDTLWPAALLLVAWSAWQSPTPAHGAPIAARPWLTTAALSGLAVIGVLIYDFFHRLNPLALAFAAVTLLVIIVRTGLTFRENKVILEQMREQAVTDALTELGNRRRLIDALDHALRDRERSEPRMLVIFDLDGFKRYNDTFGHPAGDALLRRLGGKLARSVDTADATSYRLGGDEFCVLARVRPDSAGRLLDETSNALAEEGEGFSITASFGAVFLPDEAAEPSEALRLADERLYIQKHSAQLTRTRPHEVLLQVMSEREPDLFEHSQGVALLSVEVGRRLGLLNDELPVLRIAAELHDVGKLAIPDEILLKPGSLTRDEEEFVRKHPAIGQRILSAAPALKEVGRIVRASHERWDGMGYVDGLQGEEIPLAARIITVCDAFKAMTSGRPYGNVLTPDAALGEIRRCSGGQFDPRVVTALVAAVESAAAADTESSAFA